MSHDALQLQPLVLWGATGQAIVLGEFCEQVGYKLTALFDRAPALRSPFDGVPLFAGEQGFEEWRHQHPGPIPCAVAIGGYRGADRLERLSYLLEQGLRAVELTHPRAMVASNVKRGSGVQILAGATIAARAVLGDAVIVNHGAVVEHECELEAGVHMGPGATLCGVVRIGRCTLVGAGAVVLPRVRIGANSIVGAGSVVTRDIPDNVIAFGNPARIIGPRPANALTV